MHKLYLSCRAPLRITTTTITWTAKKLPPILSFRRILHPLATVFPKKKIPHKKLHAKKNKASAGNKRRKIEIICPAGFFAAADLFAFIQPTPNHMEVKKPGVLFKRKEGACGRTSWFFNATHSHLLVFIFRMYFAMDVCVCVFACIFNRHLFGWLANCEFFLFLLLVWLTVPWFTALFVALSSHLGVEQKKNLAWHNITKKYVK